MGLMIGLGSTQLFAASGESRAYAEALVAFHEQAYSVAQSRLNQFLQKYRKSTNAPMAVLLLAQSDYYLGNAAGVTNRLGDSGNLAKARAAGIDDAYAYWRAEAEFALGDFSRAGQTFVSLAEEYPQSSLALSAVIEGAAAFGRHGDWAHVDQLLGTTNGLFQRVAALDPGNTQVANGWLLAAESKYRQRDFVAAHQILGLIHVATLKPDQDWNRTHLACLASEGENNLAAALVAATNLLQIARSGHGDGWDTNLAESVACHATILEKLGRLPEAVDAWEEDLAKPVPAEQQKLAIVKCTELALAQRKLGEAEARLEDYLRASPDSPVADIASLALGELHLRDFAAQPSASNHLAMARARLDEFIATATNTELVGKAYLDRGWSEWLVSRMAEAAGSTNAAPEMAASLADFQAAAQRPLSPDDLVVAKFKSGDALFALNRYSDAQTNYDAVLADAQNSLEGTNSLVGLALYQKLRVCLALTNAEAVDETVRALLRRFPDGIPTESGLLMAGEGFADLNLPLRAREMLQEFQERYTNSPLLADVEFAQARTYEREQEWSAAASHYAGWLKAYPAGELRPQVEYSLGQAVFLAGNESQAFELFTNFVGRYTNELTPLALWWTAEHYFRTGTNFVPAELNYQLIFQNFPTNELAGPAQLMAGRSALGRFDYKGALHYLDPLVNDAKCPANLLTQALFAYCEALRQITDTNNESLEEATKILSGICAKNPTNEIGSLAWSEVGDCDWQLGAYDAATNAYAQVLILDASSRELCCRARVGAGIALEKKAEGKSGEVRKGLWKQALENYQAVFASLPDSETEYWRKKAGLQILSLNLKSNLLKGNQLDKFILDLRTNFPQLSEAAELKRLTDQ